MNIQDYSDQAISTDTFAADQTNIDSHSFLEKAFGLSGEAGEFAEKLKKILRDKDGQATEQDRIEMAKELGDVLWYVNALSLRLGLSLEEVAQMNLDKVLSRQARGVTHGSGDNR